MKICSIICEFNPFHNGHAYLIEQAKKISGCDAVICIVSGNFTQRGDICIIDKFTRAKHAVLGGADAVIELPAPFAVAPAEIFAKGAFKLLASIPEVDCIAFGCETPSDFLSAAELLNKESETFKCRLAEYLDSGLSYTRSYANAFEACGGDGNLLNGPNNILAVAYTKAALSCAKRIKLYPVQRVGGAYKENELTGCFSSSSAIRANLDSSQVKQSIPSYVFSDLKKYTPDYNVWSKILQFTLIQNKKSKICDIFGCTEGLENKLKDLSYLPTEEIILQATGKRYTTSRIKRILTCNALGLFKNNCLEFLNENLYLKPLAVKNSRKDELMNALSKSPFPLIVKGRDKNTLSKTAAKCFALDEFALQVWNLVCGANIYNDTMLSVETNSR